MKFTGSAERAKSFILNYMAARIIASDAESTLPPGKSVIRNKKLGTDILNHLKDNSPQSFWEVGTVVHEEVQYVGIRLDGKDLDRILNDHASDPSATPEPLPKNSGRLCGLHGEAVAKVTVRYLLADDATYRAATKMQLMEELAAEYKRLRHAPPSNRNLGLITDGIIRVVADNRD
jgi:hypothetical protein